MNLANPQTRGRVHFLLLATLFLAPLLIAYSLYFYFPDSRPSGTTNYGMLIAPALPLPPLALETEGGERAADDLLQGRWTFVYLSGETCDAVCLDRLLMSRQVRIAMNEKRSRVARVVIAPGPGALATLRDAIPPIHDDLTLVADAGAVGARAQDFFAQAPAGSLLLLDPHGNWMMYYPPGAARQTEFKGIQKDIKKLLRLSQIG